MAKKRLPTRWLTIFKALLWPGVWMAVIFAGSARAITPGARVSLLDFIFKKTLHLGEYAILFGCWWRFYRQTWPHKSRKHWWVMVLLCVVYAIIDEWHQSFVPGRTATARDVGFDTLGALLAAAWVYRLI